MPIFTGPLKSWNIEPAESAQENAKKSFLSDLGQSMPDLSSTPESFLPAFQPPPRQYPPSGEGATGFVTDALGNVVAGGLQSLGSIGYAAAEKLGAPETAQNILTGANVLSSRLGTGPYRNENASAYDRIIDPEWWRTSFSYGVGSSAAFALPGIVVGPAMAAAAVPMAAALGVGVTGAAAIGLTTGILGSAGMDSLLESASAYTDARQSGKTVEEANRIASDVGFNNLVLNVGLETATLGLGVGARSFVRALNKAPVPAVVRGVAGTELAGAAAQNLARSVGMQGWRPVVVGGAIAVGDALVEAIQEQQQGEIQKAASEGRPWDMVRAMTSNEYTDDGLVGFFNALAMGPLGAGGAMSAAKTLPSTLRGDKATVREAASQAAGAWLQGLRPQAPSFFNTFDFNVPTNRNQPVEIGLSDSARALVQPPRQTPEQKTGLEAVREAMAAIGGEPTGTAPVTTQPLVSQPISVPSTPGISVAVPPMATAATEDSSLLLRTQRATSRRREEAMASGRLAAPELVPIQAGAPNHYVSDSYGMIDTIAKAIQADNPELATRVRESLGEFSASPAASGLTAGLNTYINDAFSGREDSAVTRVLRRIAEENGLIGKEGSSMASPNISIVLAAPDVSLSGHISGGSVYNPSVENVFSSIPGAGSFDQGRYITVNAVTPYLQAKALEQSGSVTKEEAANIFAASLLHNIAHEMLHPMGLVHGGQSQPGLVVDINEGKYTKYQQELLQAIVEDTAGRAEETYLAVGFSSATGTFPVQYLSAIAQAYDADGLEKFAKTYLEGYDEWLVTEVAKDPNGGARRASELRANRQSSRSNSGNGELGIYRRGAIEPFRRSFASRRAAASRAGVSAGQQGAAGGEPRGAAATVVEPAKPAQPAPPAPPARPTSVARKDIEKADAIGSLLAEAQVDFNDLSEGFDYVSENENSRLLQTWTEDELASKLFDRAFASLENQDNANFNKYKRSILKAKFDIISSEDWKSVYEMLEDDDQPIGPEPEVDLARPEQPSSEIVSASGDVFSAVRSSLIDSAKDIYDSLDENYIDSLTENGELDGYLYDRVVSEQFPEPPGSDELAKLKARFTDPDVKQEIINSEEWSETIYGTTIDTDVTDLDALAEQYPGAFAPISPDDPLNAIVLGEEVEPDTSQSTIGLRDATESEIREYVDYIHSQGLATEPAESELKPLPKYIEADNVDIEISVVESDDEDPFEVFSITIKDPDGQTIDSIVALTKILENEIRGFKLQSRVINPRQNPQSIRFRIYADNLREENGNISPAQLLEKIQVIVSPESFSAEKEAKINDDRSIIAKVRAKIVDDPEFKSNPDRALNTFNALIEKIASNIALEGYIGIKQFIELYNDALKEWTKTVRGKVALVASLEDRSRLSSLIRIVENLDYREIEAIAARSLFNVERKARSFEEAVREVGGIDVQEKKQKSDIIVQDILQEIEKLKKVIAARRNRGLDSDLSTKKILVLQEKLRRVRSANAENIDDQLNLDLPKAIRENFSLRRKIIKGAKINFTSEFWDSLRRSASKQSGVNASIPREYLAIKRSGVVGTISDIGLDGVFIIFEVPVETIKSAYGNIESEIVPKVNEIIRVKIPATKAGVAVLQRGIITSSPIANLNEDLVIGDADPRSRDYGIAGLNKAEIGLSAEEKYTVASGSIIGIYPNVAAGQDTSAYRLEKTKKVFQILRETMVASSTGGFKDIALIRAAQKRVKDFIDTVIKSPNNYFGGIISEAFSDAARRIKTQAPTAAQRKLMLDYTGTIFYDNNGSILINYAGKTYKYADDGSFKVAEKFIESDKSADAFPIEGALLYSLIRNKIAKHPVLLAMQYAQTFSGKKFEDLKPSEILDSIIKGQKNAAIALAQAEIDRLRKAIAPQIPGQQVLQSSQVENSKFVETYGRILWLINEKETNPRYIIADKDSSTTKKIKEVRLARINKEISDLQSSVVVDANQKISMLEERIRGIKSTVWDEQLDPIMLDIASYTASIEALKEKRSQIAFRIAEIKSELKRTPSRRALRRMTQEVKELLLQSQLIYRDPKNSQSSNTITGLQALIKLKKDQVSKITAINGNPMTSAEAASQQKKWIAAVNKAMQTYNSALLMLGNSVDEARNKLATDEFNKLKDARDTVLGIDYGELLNVLQIGRDLNPEKFADYPSNADLQVAQKFGVNPISELSGEGIMSDVYNSLIAQRFLITQIKFVGNNSRYGSGSDRYRFDVSFVHNKKEFETTDEQLDAILQYLNSVINKDAAGRIKQLTSSANPDFIPSMIAVRYDAAQDELGDEAGGRIRIPDAEARRPSKYFSRFGGSTGAVVMSLVETRGSALSRNRSPIKPGSIGRVIGAGVDRFTVEFDPVDSRGVVTTGPKIVAEIADEALYVIGDPSPATPSLVSVSGRPGNWTDIPPGSGGRGKGGVQWNIWHTLFAWHDWNANKDLRAKELVRKLFGLDLQKGSAVTLDQAKLIDLVASMVANTAGEMRDANNTPIPDGLVSSSELNVDLRGRETVDMYALSKKIIDNILMQPTNIYGMNDNVKEYIRERLNYHYDSITRYGNAQNIIIETDEDGYETKYKITKDGKKMVIADTSPLAIANLYKRISSAYQSDIISDDLYNQIASKSSPEIARQIVRLLDRKNVLKNRLDVAQQNLVAAKKGKSLTDIQEAELEVQKAKLEYNKIIRQLPDVIDHTMKDGNQIIELLAGDQTPDLVKQITSSFWRTWDSGDGRRWMTTKKSAAIGARVHPAARYIASRWLALSKTNKAGADKMMAALMDSAPDYLRNRKISIANLKADITSLERAISNVNTKEYSALSIFFRGVERGETTTGLDWTDSEILEKVDKYGVSGKRKIIDYVASNVLDEKSSEYAEQFTQLLIDLQSLRINYSPNQLSSIYAIINELKDDYISGDIKYIHPLPSKTNNPEMYYSGALTKQFIISYLESLKTASNRRRDELADTRADEAARDAVTVEINKYQANPRRYANILAAKQDELRIILKRIEDKRAALEAFDAAMLELEPQRKELEAKFNELFANEKFQLSRPVVSLIYPPIVVESDGENAENGYVLRFAPEILMSETGYTDEQRAEARRQFSTSKTTLTPRAYLIEEMQAILKHKMEEMQALRQSGARLIETFGDQSPLGFQINLAFTFRLKNVDRYNKLVQQLQENIKELEAAEDPETAASIQARIDAQRKLIPANLGPYGFEGLASWDDLDIRDDAEIAAFESAVTRQLMEPPADGSPGLWQVSNNNLVLTKTKAQSFPSPSNISDFYAAAKIGTVVYSPQYGSATLVAYYDSNSDLGEAGNVLGNKNTATIAASMYKKAVAQNNGWKAAYNNEMARIFGSIANKINSDGNVTLSQVIGDISEYVLSLYENKEIMQGYTKSNAEDPTKAVDVQIFDYIISDISQTMSAIFPVRGDGITSYYGMPANINYIERIYKSIKSPIVYPYARKASNGSSPLVDALLTIKLDSTGQILTVAPNTLGIGMPQDFITDIKLDPGYTLQSIAEMISKMSNGLRFHDQTDYSRSSARNHVRSTLGWDTAMLANLSIEDRTQVVDSILEYIAKDIIRKTQEYNTIIKRRSEQMQGQEKIEFIRGNALLDEKLEAAQAIATFMTFFTNQVWQEDVVSLVFPKNKTNRPMKKSFTVFGSTLKAYDLFRANVTDALSSVYYEWQRGPEQRGESLNMSSLADFDLTKKYAETFANAVFNAIPGKAYRGAKGESEGNRRIAAIEAKRGTYTSGSYNIWLQKRDNMQQDTALNEALQEASIGSLVALITKRYISNASSDSIGFYEAHKDLFEDRVFKTSEGDAIIKQLRGLSENQWNEILGSKISAFKFVNTISSILRDKGRFNISQVFHFGEGMPTVESSIESAKSIIQYIASISADIDDFVKNTNLIIEAIQKAYPHTMPSKGDYKARSENNYNLFVNKIIPEAFDERVLRAKGIPSGLMTALNAIKRKILADIKQINDVNLEVIKYFHSETLKIIEGASNLTATMSEAEALMATVGASEGIDKIFETMFSEGLDSSGNPIGNLSSNNTNPTVINNIETSVAVQSSATAQAIEPEDVTRKAAIELLKEIKGDFTEEDIENIIEAISTRAQDNEMETIWAKLVDEGADPGKREVFNLAAFELEAAIKAELEAYQAGIGSDMDDADIVIEILGETREEAEPQDIADNMEDLVANWESLKRQGRALLPVFASSKEVAERFVVGGISDEIVRNKRTANYFQRMFSGSVNTPSETAMRKVLGNIEKLKADNVGQYENGYFVFFAINNTVANYIGEKTVGTYSDLTIEPDMAIGMIPAMDVKLIDSLTKKGKVAKPQKKKEKPVYKGKYPTVFGVPIEPTDEITDVIEKLMAPPKEDENRKQLTIEEATSIAQRMLSEEFDSIMQVAIKEMLPKKRIMLESTKDVKEFFGELFVAGVTDDLYTKRILHILDKKAGIVEVLTKRGVFPGSNAPYRATEEMLDFMLDDKGQLNVIVKSGKVSRGIGAARDKNIGRFWYWDANGNAVVVFDDNGTSYQDTIERNKIQFYADPNTMQDAFTKLMESGMRAAYMKEIGMGAVPRVQQEQPQQSPVEQPSEKAEATTEQIDVAENNQVVRATLDDIMDELSKLLDPNIEVTEDVAEGRGNLRYILNSEKVTEYILFNKKLFEEFSDYRESTDRDYLSFTKQHQIVSENRLADHVKQYGWNINNFTLKLLAHLIEVYANEQNFGLTIGNLIIDPEYMNNVAPVSIAKSVSVAPGATASRIKEPRKILSTDSVATIKPVMEDTAIIPESPGEPKPKADKEWGLGRARAWVAYRYASMLSGPTMLFDFAQGAVKYAKLAADIKLGAAIESSQGVKASARSTVIGDAIKLDDGTFVGFMHGWQAAMQAAMLAAKTGNVPEGMKLDMEHELVSHTLAGTRLENAAKLVEGGQRFRFASDMFWMTLGENIAIYTLAHREATREGYASGSAAYAERATYWANTIKAGMYFEKEPGTLNGTDRSLIVPRAIVRPVPGLDGSKIMPPLGKDTNLNGSRPMTIVEEARNLAQNIVYQGKMPGLGMGFTRVLYNNNLARVLIPFMRTATRIAYEGFEMTPGLGQGLLLFDMAKGRYGKELKGTKALKAAGSVLTFGAVKSDAFSRALGPTQTTVEGESALTLGAGIRPVSQRVASQLFGMGVAMVGFSLAAAGMLTGAGPDDDKERKAWLADGNRPYSLKIGNNFYNPTHILGPLAWPLIFGAIMNDAVTGRNKSTSGKEIPVEEFVKSLGTWTINQNGLNNFNVMLTAFNTTGSVNALERIAAQTLVSYALPYSSALKWLANISDSTVRDPQGFLDYGKQYIPGVAKLVPAKYNDMYEPVKKSAAQRFATPLVTSSIDTSRTIYPEFLAKSMQETVRINQAQARVNAYYRGDPGAEFPTRADLEIVKRHGLQGTNPTYAMRKSINKMIQKINEEKSNDRSWIPI